VCTAQGALDFEKWTTASASIAPIIVRAITAEQFRKGYNPLFMTNQTVGQAIAKAIVDQLRIKKKSQGWFDRVILSKDVRNAGVYIYRDLEEYAL
jgi:hypothetical protein